MWLILLEKEEFENEDKLQIQETTSDKVFNFSGN